jgi:hypothetical protein
VRIFASRAAIQNLFALVEGQRVVTRASARVNLPGQCVDDAIFAAAEAARVSHPTAFDFKTLANGCAAWVGPIASVGWRANLLSSRACSLEV